MGFIYDNHIKVGRCIEQAAILGFGVIDGS